MRVEWTVKRSGCCLFFCSHLFLPSLFPSDPLLPLQNPNLLGLLSLEDKRPMDSSSILFHEYRLNDNLEEVVLTQSICDCIEGFIRTHQSLSGLELQSLVEKLIFQLQSTYPKCSFSSPWEKQYAFMCVCKLVLLSRALLHSLDARYVHAVALRKTVSSVLTEAFIPFSTTVGLFAT